jgi:hypothetical protein
VGVAFGENGAEAAATVDGVGAAAVYEARYVRPLSRRRFAIRMAIHAAAALGLMSFSLLAGMWGYEHYENLPWRDAFLNSAMLLGGEGPINPLHSNGGKVFAGFYALYAGGVFLVVAGTLLVPIVHRVLHRIHWEEDEVRRGNRGMV